MRSENVILGDHSKVPSIQRVAANRPDYWAIRRYRLEASIDPFSYPLMKNRDGWIALRLAGCDRVLESGAGERLFLPHLTRASFCGAFETMDVGKRNLRLSFAGRDP
jgi:hypothetical protein